MDKVKMIESVKRYLSLFGEIGDYEKKILWAMSLIDRKFFVKKDLIQYAYADTALPTKGCQTISQPSTVARMLQLLRLNRGDNVVEIGTGSGWNACLIGYLVGGSGHVLSLEIVNELFNEAKERIRRFGIKNIEIAKKDFRELPGKFNKIIFTAGITEEQEKIIENYAETHLLDRGILICPHKRGKLIIFKKISGKIEKNLTNEEYNFVKLVL